MEKQEKRKTVTVIDIAGEAGVSIGTVSRALAGEKGMRPEIRKIITEIATRLNYHPNLRARGLVSRKIDVVGIIIPHTSEFVFSNPFYSEIIKGIGQTARGKGLYLLFSFAGQERYEKMFQNGLAAGLIILGNRMDDPRIDEVKRLEVPIVLIPGYSIPQRIPSVDVDNRTGALLAVEHLIKLGHRRIGFINGSINSRYSVERLRGFLMALERHGLSFDPDLVYESDFTQQDGYEGMKKLLTSSHPPTAVFIINDYSALGALKGAKELGFRIPQDVSVVGFGNFTFSRLIDPPLTTVNMPFQKVGEEAIEMLFKIIQGIKLPQRHRILAVNLVVRESTAPPI